MCVGSFIDETGGPHRNTVNLPSPTTGQTLKHVIGTTPDPALWSVRLQYKEVIHKDRKTVKIQY